MAVFVWLVCVFASVVGTATGATTASPSSNYRKNSNEMQRHIREAVSCENRLHSGGGQSCCGGQAFNPETATCCEVEDGYPKTAVTEGLSEKVSACCGLKAYDPLNEMCCESTVVAKPAPTAACCGTKAINKDTHLCCGPPNNKTIQTKKTSDHLCCGQDSQFNRKTECCCSMTKTVLQTQPITSVCCDKKLEYCGGKQYEKVYQLCCGSTVKAKPTLDHECCGDEAIDTNKQLCCGPHGNKTIQAKHSSDHLCCGHNVYDKKTECCCSAGNGHIQPISSECCLKKLCQDLKQNPKLLTSCTEPDTRLCGSTCYNPKNSRCCEKKLGKSQCAQGRFDDLSRVYNPDTHVCLGGCVSERGSWIEDDDLPEQHHCGTEVYSLDTEICCEGHRHPKTENTHCCGVKAYNIKDPLKKCCAGTLHHVAVGHEAACCGSVLQSSQHNVCCSSTDDAVLYSKKTGFGCCGHFYFNRSLWSCCAGKLSPEPEQPGVNKESRLSDLNDADLCNEIQIGTVQSVSRYSIMFSNVLKIHGRNGTVTSLASPYVLPTHDKCSFPKLTPGKNYFFNEANVYADFNHDSVHQSIHFIFSKC